MRGRSLPLRCPCYCLVWDWRLARRSFLALGTTLRHSSLAAETSRLLVTVCLVSFTGLGRHRPPRASRLDFLVQYWCQPSPPPAALHWCGIDDGYAAGAKRRSTKAKAYEPATCCANGRVPAGGVACHAVGSLIRNTRVDRNTNAIPCLVEHLRHGSCWATWSRKFEVVPRCVDRSRVARVACSVNIRRGSCYDTRYVHRRNVRLRETFYYQHDTRDHVVR